MMNNLNIIMRNKEFIGGNFNLFSKKGYNKIIH